MKCAVYRSNKKEFTYLYLPEDDDFSRVPDSLRKLIEPLERVLEVDLADRRTLAQEDPAIVLEQIKEQGWFLQMPKTEEFELNS